MYSCWGWLGFYVVVVVSSVIKSFVRERRKWTIFAIYYLYGIFLYHVGNCQQLFCTAFLLSDESKFNFTISTWENLYKIFFLELSVTKHFVHIIVFKESFLWAYFGLESPIAMSLKKSIVCICCNEWGKGLFLVSVESKAED